MSAAQEDAIECQFNGWVGTARDSEASGIEGDACSARRARLSPPPVIRDLWATDLTNGFLEVLDTLHRADLTLDAAREILRKRLSMGVRTFVAVRGDRVVGTASLVPEPKFYGVAAHIEDVAVHPDCQGQDIGAALMRHVLAEARRMGCYKVILNCTEAVKPFYEKLGFRAHNVGMRREG